MTITTLAVAAGGSFLIALALCGVIRAFALRRALVDLPNERSLHSVPVPRMGGVGITIGICSVMAVVLLLSPERAANDVLLWLGAGILTAAVGLVDDLRPISAGVRMLIQLTIATTVTLAIGAPRTVVLAEGVGMDVSTWVTAPLTIIWVVGVLNIYNFMDGMDGLAGAQAVGGGAAVAAAFAIHGQLDLALVAALLAAASGGFFIHNVGPARIFMGDAGSTMIGFTFAALAFMGQGRPDPLPVAVVPLALAPFLLDGTFTVLRRALRGERVWRAHRSHLYQRAVTSGLSHRDVLGPYAGWMGAAAIAAVLAARANGIQMIALAAAMLSGLVAMWRWVVGLEARPSSR